MGMFGSKKEKIDVRTPEQKAVGKNVTGALFRATDNYTPGEEWKRDTDVNLTDLEQQSLSQLGAYMDQGLSSNEAYQAGKAVILQNTKSPQDIVSGDTYKAFRDETERQQEKAIDVVKRQQSMRGSLSSLGTGRLMGDVATDTANRRSTLLASLQENERNRQERAAAASLTLGEFEQNEPLRKAQFGQQLGALERNNEINNIVREFEAYKLQRTESLAAFEAAGGMSNWGQPIWEEKVTPSKWGGALSGAMSGASAGSIGGPWGMVIGAVAGGAAGYNDPEAFSGGGSGGGIGGGGGGGLSSIMGMMGGGAGGGMASAGSAGSTGGMSGAGGYSSGVTGSASVGGGY